MIDNLKVYNLNQAVISIRNSHNSVNLSDTHRNGKLGEKDLELAQKLVRLGGSHRKFMRMIIINCDINASLCWWKQFDTYKIGTVANSFSTMHNLIDRNLKLEDFKLMKTESVVNLQKMILPLLNNLLKEFKERNDDELFQDLCYMLPSGYLQKRTVLLNYEVMLYLFRAQESQIKRMADILRNNVCRTSAFRRFY